MLFLVVSALLTFHRLPFPRTLQIFPLELLQQLGVAPTVPMEENRHPLPGRLDGFPNPQSAIRNPHSLGFLRLGVDFLLLGLLGRREHAQGYRSGDAVDLNASDPRVEPVGGGDLDHG